MEAVPPVRPPAPAPVQASPSWTAQPPPPAPPPAPGPTATVAVVAAAPPPPAAPPAGELDPTAWTAVLVLTVLLPAALAAALGHHRTTSRSRR
ncbi:hypothetical protein ABZW10_16900 [Kitasatospora sp. NPDC004723]|uniref:hypothetical protein n=1 Tax=Kitasatospora sp. NPDC004723 TaxID=3154288 RepID=UPI0033BC60D8